MSNTLEISKKKLVLFFLDNKGVFKRTVMLQWKDHDFFVFPHGKKNPDISEK